jgi:integrase
VKRIVMLTDLELKALTAADARRSLSDTGGLTGKVRVKQSGAVVVGFEYRYRRQHRSEGQSTHRTIGVGIWPDESLRNIRKRRDAIRVQIEQGQDPLDIKNAQKLTSKAEVAEERANAQNRLDALTLAQQRMTVGNLFDRWESLALINRKDKGAEIRRMFTKDVLPQIGGMAVEDVKKRHIAAMLDKISERGVGRMVNLMLAQVRQMFRFALSRDWIEADPTATLRKADFGGKDIERDRVLTESEIKELVLKMHEAKLQPQTEAAIWVMLATCCRVGELSQAKWADLDLEDGWWRIPAANAKNQREHMVYLSDFAIKHFKTIKKVQTSAVWVLPASKIEEDGSQTHLDEKAITKQVRDRQRIKPLKGRSSASNALLLAKGSWTPHDLRRTGATMMGELGADGDVIERCLNHIEPNRIKRTYQRQKMELAQKQAWAMLGRSLEILTNEELNNVVILKA